MTAKKKLMLENAFRFVERSVFLIGENNLRLQIAVQKIGTKFLAKFENSKVVYAIGRNEFREL